MSDVTGPAIDVTDGPSPLLQALGSLVSDVTGPSVDVTDEPSPLLQALGADYAHLVEKIQTLGSVDDLSNLLRKQGRPALIEALRKAGVDRLPERQHVANTLGRMSRQKLPPCLLPGDKRLFLTPWNWVVTADAVAVTATPGAYL